ncbi:MAG: cysteine--tRNA ligase [Acidobacteriota bacterium]
MGVRLTNTYQKRVEDLDPIAPGKILMYTCGPTVHDYAHIGNFRTYVFEDVLRRHLEARGFAVTQVMNVTDIEDRIIQKSRDAGKTIYEYTDVYTRAFFEDVDRLRILRAHHYPRATGYVPQMIALIQRLEAAGVTYVSDGSVYFKIASFPAYGKLSGFDIAQVKPGARVDVDDYDKQDARDFVLWKAAKEGEPSWDSPWGKGRPGWHIECSAMSMELLGPEIDIHTGGVDNIFPHHENEIAQSVMATGKRFVRHWVHAEHLLVDARKMAKRENNFFTVRDLMDQGISAAGLRYFLLSHHYRAQLNFTIDGVAAAEAALERLRALQRRLSEHAATGTDDLAAAIREAGETFGHAMDEDLNTSEALAALFILLPQVNAAMDRGALSPAGRDAALRLFESVDRELAVLEEDPVELPGELSDLVAARGRAREAKDWAEADRLRRILSERGVAIEDKRQGARVTYQGRPVRASADSP